MKMLRLTRSALLSVCLCASTLAVTAQTPAANAQLAPEQVVAIAEHGFVIKNQIRTAATTEQVWLALVNDIDKWWPKDHSWWNGTFSIQARAGGCFCEMADDKSAEHMHISHVNPGKLLRMTGGLGPLQGMGMHGALDFAFSQDDGHTVVTMTYTVTGFQPDGFAELAPIVAKVQRMQLNGLRTFVDGQSAAQ